jgi:hypothetical protein
VNDLENMGEEMELRSLPNSLLSLTKLSALDKFRINMV